MYLTDLAFIEEGTPNYTEDGLVNFSKMRMVSLPAPLRRACGVRGAAALARSVPTPCSPRSWPSSAQRRACPPAPVQAAGVVPGVRRNNKALCVVPWWKGADGVRSTSRPSPSQVVGRGDGAAAKSFCVLSPDRFHISSERSASSSKPPTRSSTSLRYGPVPRAVRSLSSSPTPIAVFKQPSVSGSSFGEDGMLL